MNDFVQHETFYLINWNINKILNISGILEIKKMADHILEITGLEGCFVIIVSLNNISKIRLPTMNAASYL